MVNAVRFEFATATEIVFGEGARGQAADRVRSLGATALIVTGRDGSRAAWLVDALRAQGVAYVLYRAPGEPTVDEVAAARDTARAHGADVVVAVGGGSAIDLGKAVAALLANPGDPLDFIEVVGRGRVLSRPSVPCVTIPTTAGAGAEVTRNAVLGAPAHGVKASLRSPLMLPRLAIVDPELTLELPPSLTASTGMDALTQLIEPYLSVRANPLVDGFCVEGLRRVARSLRRAARDGQDLAARIDMSLASLLGGLALANAGLGAVHGFAAPIGGRFAAPHGAVCAALLPAVMRVNLDAVRARAPGSPALARLQTIARLVTGDEAARAEDGLEWLEQLREDLAIPRLSQYGLTSAHAADLVEAACHASSMRGNCIALERDELRRALESSL
jgi:alcohol dehydrogenase class IV